ncbi:hypothetical protein [Corynebacterium liangguodongii]|uniref:Uncharacterized protein n=1 Tax=Corynebacterium liangguodongii TaxID=2079535 RepID=A0A2S0WCE1_9CORY|nr:hypothetical protein [Corynebacterium liangguodongii]AWB83420.1 hypothetical protein C3E79_02045 [Corynebacterium liangguodongii]PWC00490.1 hypothetical protein DF219_00905 [Corynebacterium liangguodongii]
MLKLSNINRRWVGLALALWLIVLVAIIFIPLSRGTTAAAYPNSLEKALQLSEPAKSDAVMGELVNPARIYGEEYAGYTMLCPNEPAEMIDAKLDAFGLDASELDLGGESGYMVLLPARQSGDVMLDPVNLNAVNICTVPQTESFRIDAAIPFFVEDGTWTMGIAS